VPLFLGNIAMTDAGDSEKGIRRRPYQSTIRSVSCDALPFLSHGGRRYSAVVA